MRCSQPLFSWLIVLVVYLWVTGGFGWTKAQEFATTKRMKPTVRVVNIILWPVFAAVAAVGEFWYTVRRR